MHYKSDELQETREEIRQALFHLGWEERASRYPASYAVVEKPWMYSPQVMNDRLELEQDLKRINEEKAYHAAETLGYEMEHISWECNKNNRNAEGCMPMEEAMEQVDRWLVEGIPYERDYLDVVGRRVKNEGRLIFVDWDHPERNSFSFVQNWRGMRNDGFAWDFVLMLNSIPLCAIILAPYDPRHDAWEMEAVCREESLQMEEDYVFRTYLRLMLYGNGKNLLYGTRDEPDDLVSLFGDTLEEQLKKVLDRKNFLDVIGNMVYYIAEEDLFTGTPFWADVMEDYLKRIGIK